MWELFAGAFVLAAGACLWAARKTLSLYDAEIRRPFVVFLVLTAGWAVSNIFVIAPVSLSVMHASYIIGLVIGFPTVVVWLWFCSAYAGTPYHYNRRVQALTLGLTGSIILVKLTNPLHELYFRPAVASRPFRHFAPETGLLYWLVAALAYIGAAIGLYILFDLYASSQFKTTSVAALTVLIGLPVVPKLFAIARPDSMVLLFYEPLGAAIFAVGITTVAQDTFLSVRAPARRQLANQLSEIIIVVDQDGRIAEYNESAEAVFDGLIDALGAPLAATIPRVANHEGGGELLKVELEAGPCYYTVRTREIRLDRNMIGRAFVLSDVTELETQRRQLKQQTDHLENVTEEVAHQLRNPLTVLKGELEWLRSSRVSTAADDESDSGDSIDAAIEATERIEQIAEDLISVIPYGKPISGMELLAVTELVEDAAAEHEWPDVAVEVVCRDAPLLRAERVRCRELLGLLFRVHYERGATVVSVDQAGNRLTVSSDGELFNSLKSEELFEYGIETDEDIRMLLANARILAQIHGWSISVEQDCDAPVIVLDGITFRTNEE
jgi:signal transduction histidine kinase